MNFARRKVSRIIIEEAGKVVHDESQNTGDSIVVYAHKDIETGQQSVVIRVKEKDTGNIRTSQYSLGVGSTHCIHILEKGGDNEEVEVPQ